MKTFLNVKLFLVLIVFIFCGFQKAEAATLDYQSTSVFGTSTLDYGSAMKTDSNGNVYVAGQFSAGTVDFDPTIGVDNKTNTLGGYDIFLTKMNADGTYGWTKTWGGTGNDASYNLAIDSSNNVYIVGEFLATVDFDPGVGNTSYTSAGSVDIFLSKFDTNGNFLSVKVMGSTSHDRGHGVVINGTGEIFIAGKFNGTVDFDPSSGVDNKLSAGNYDAYLTKFNADGTYGWTKTWGSTNRDTINDLQLGTDGSIYLAGVYGLTVDFDPSGSVDNQTSVGLDDPFLTKLNADGTYAWTKTWGSTLNDFSFNLRVNSSNNVYIIGSFQGTVDFDPSGATNSIVSAGLEDSYVSKFDANGNYIFTRTWGGSLMDEVLGITIDTGGNYFIGGFFNGTEDLDPTSGIDSRTSTGAYDMFVSMFDINDNYITSKTFGSGTETNWWDDQLYELHAYHGILNIVGNYVGTADFDPTSGTDTKVAVGSGDFFRSTYTTGYSINFDAQSGSVSPSSKNVTYYSAVGSLPTPTLSGYSFSGWNTATDGSGTTYTDSSVYLLNTDLTLYANFSSSDDMVEQASIRSFTSYQYDDLSKSCSNRLKLIIKGKHFAKKAEVKIGSAEALSVKRESSKKITATFCLTKLLSVQTDPKRKVSIENPDADKEEADKKINLEMVSGNIETDTYSTETAEGIKNVQKKLHALGLLDQENITGFYGPLTKEAIKGFQTKNSIPSTGIVGPLTQAALKKQ